MAYPTLEASPFSIQRPFQIPDLRTLSYDEIVSLLESIESDSFEERCSMDQLDQMNRLISFLAMEGATEDKKNDVAMSVATLFKTDSYYYAD